MTRIAAFLIALGLAAGCSGGDGSNPFDPENPDGGGDGGGDNGTPIDSDRVLPPGTASPAPDYSIFRREEADDAGSGTATTISYDSTTDTFRVDNLAFDGDNAYSRDDEVPSLNGFAVYENASQIADPLNASPIAQLEHKALYRVSDSGLTELAIVRTGAYRNYGFGGFVYQRNGGVTLPTSGQAIYTGDYAALRDFEGAAGIEYATGDIRVAIDFEDFDNGGGVRGLVQNRRVFNTAGQDITDNILQALEDKNGVNYTELPMLTFYVGPGVGDANGELVGTLDSTIATDNGPQVFEEGNYYALLAGDNAAELAGVIVVTADDPRFTGVTVRETGGFVARR